MPRSYTVTAKAPGSGGKTMRLSATGMGKDFFDRPQQQNGVIELVQEGSGWKISEVSWGKRKLP